MKQRPTLLVRPSRSAVMSRGDCYDDIDCISRRALCPGRRISARLWNPETARSGKSASASCWGQLLIALSLPHCCRNGAGLAHPRVITFSISSPASAFIISCLFVSLAKLQRKQHRFLSVNREHKEHYRGRNATIQTRIIESHDR